MSTVKPPIKRYFDELYHKGGHGGGNPWHDPKTGKFTSGPLGKAVRTHGGAYEDYINRNGSLTDKAKARLNASGQGSGNNGGGDGGNNSGGDGKKKGGGGGKPININKKGLVEENDQARAMSQIEKNISDDYTNKSKIYSEAKKMTEDTSSLFAMKRKNENARAANSLDLSHMTDQDLRDYINRKALERQYRDAASADADRGHAKIEEFLKYSGALLGLAASAATIAATVHKIRS